MKRLINVIILASVFALTGAFSWDGAAVVAPEGELPAAGFYVATDIFPRNTIVDITNIETDRTVRVMVAKRLDTPDIIAMVSKDAAALIGMRAGIVTMLRMVQPIEPIAYSRFTDSAISGIPEYDPGRLLAEELYREDTYIPPVLQPESVPQIQTEVIPPSYTLEREWLERDVIVDLPFNYVYPTMPEYTPPIITTQPEQSPAVVIVEEVTEEVIEDEFENEQERLAELFFEDGEEEVEEETVEIAEETPEDEEEIAEIAEETPEEEEGEEGTVEIAEETPEEELEEETVEIAEETPEEELVEITEEEPEEESVEIVEEEPEEEFVEIVEEEPEEEFVEIAEEIPEETLEVEPVEIVDEPVESPFVLVQAEERPPESLYGINPDDIIPGIKIPEPEWAPERYEINPTDIIPGITPPETYTETPSIPIPPQITIPDTLFPEYVIPALEQGRYYVQIAAFDNIFSVENALLENDQIHRYEPKIYKDNSNWYRILLGPLNQGESAAVLQRFKSLGYSEAFVRYGY